MSNCSLQRRARSTLTSDFLCEAAKKNEHLPKFVTYLANLTLFFPPLLISNLLLDITMTELP